MPEAPCIDSQSHSYCSAPCARKRFHPPSGLRSVLNRWRIFFPDAITLSRWTRGIPFAQTGVTLARYAPTIFTINRLPSLNDRRGLTQGAVTIAATGDIVAPEASVPGSGRAVHRGENIIVYCTGLGAVTNQPATGAAASLVVSSETTVKPTVSIGGASATISFSGLTPGLVGVYQINFQVPNNAPLGRAVPLQLSIGGVSSKRCDDCDPMIGASRFCCAKRKGEFFMGH